MSGGGVGDFSVSLGGAGVGFLGIFGFGGI